VKDRFAKVDALMALCDQLEARLDDAETARRRLLESKCRSNRCRGLLLWLFGRAALGEIPKNSPEPQTIPRVDCSSTLWRKQ